MLEHCDVFDVIIGLRVFHSHILENMRIVVRTKSGPH